MKNHKNVHRYLKLRVQPNVARLIEGTMCRPNEIFVQRTNAIDNIFLISFNWT